jgi:hypothetical protein
LSDLDISGSYFHNYLILEHYPDYPLVKLIDVFPDSLSYHNVDIYTDKDTVLTYPMGGYEILVQAEVFRGRYRDSFENPEP